MNAYIRPASRHRRAFDRLVRIALLALPLVLALAISSRAEAQDSTATSPRPADPFSTGGAASGGTMTTATENQTPSEEKWGWSIFGDQDSVYPWLGHWGGDQNYTMGVGLQITGKFVTSVTAPVRWIDRFFGAARLHHNLANESTSLLPFGVPSYFESHTLTLGNGAFTPRRLDLDAPIFDDRPYASILSLTAAHSTIDPYKRRVLRTDLTIGALGLRLSDHIQTSIHTSRRRNNQKKDPTVLTPYDPKGWPHQISDGGEPTAKYTATWLQAVTESKAHDLALQTEGSLGYYTNAAVGFIARVGWLRSDFWSVQTNPLTTVNQGLRDSGSAPPSQNRIPPRDRSRKKLEAYLYASGRGRLVLFNELLQGGFRHSDVKFDATEVERVLTEIDAGGTLSLRGLSLTIALTRRSPEYNVGFPRIHTWGGIYVVYRSQ